ncbi:MAG: GntR family transcriptional regulator [Lachnospiraceae bacterium]|nr:GntR family transcriptional regulator [Lachnospiraceae bacterium]
MDADKGNEKLKYIKLYNWEKTLILSNVLKEGDKLSSEHQLQKKFGYSRQTVRAALDKLEEDGLITRVRGSGTYVSYKGHDEKFPRKSVGLILSYFSDYLFPQIYSGIESVFEDNGISVDVAVTKNQLNDERSFLERFLSSDPQGLIIEGTRSAFPNPNTKLYEELDRRNIPVIFIHNHYSNIKLNSIEMDDYGCCYALTEKLIDSGHKKIAAVFKYDELQGIERYRGFIQCMSDHSLTINDESVKWYSTKDSDYSFSKKSTSAYLKKISDCTAVISYNDEIATHLIDSFLQRGIRVPEDISIVSFDDMSFGNSPVRLVSAVHPKAELGKRAAQTLMDMINDPDWKNHNYSYRFPVQINYGNSVRNLT